MTDSEKKTGVLNKYLNKIDMYGSNFEFNINGQGSVTSIFGGLLTLSTIILTILLIAYNIYTFVNKPEPIVTSTVQYLDPSNIESISSSNIEVGMGFSIVTNNATPMPIVVKNTEIKNNKRKLFDPVAFEPHILGNLKSCNYEENKAKTLLSEKINDRYKADSSKILCSDFLGIDKIVAANNNSKFNVTSEVELVTDPLNTGRIYELLVNNVIDLCSIDSNCNDQQYMTNLNKDGNHILMIFYKDTYVSVNIQEGFESKVVTEAITVDYNSNYNVVFTVKKNTINTDRNILFNFKEKEKMVFHSYAVNVWPREKAASQPKNTMNVNLRFIIDKQDTIYERSYEKVDALIANTYAIYGLIVVICQIIIFIFDIGKVEFFLINNIYGFDIEKTDKELESKENHGKEVIEIGNQNRSSEISEFKTVNKRKSVSGEFTNNKTDNDADDDKVLKRNVFKLFFDKYLGCCCSKSNYRISLEKAEELLENDLNIITIIKKMIKLEKIEEEIKLNEKEVNGEKLVKRLRKIITKAEYLEPGVSNSK